jgi:hypothetical protein
MSKKSFNSLPKLILHGQTRVPQVSFLTVIFRQSPVIKELIFVFDNNQFFDIISNFIDFSIYIKKDSFM